MKKENGPKAVSNQLFSNQSVSLRWRKVHEQAETYCIGEWVSVYTRSGRDQVGKVYTK